MFFIFSTLHILWKITTEYVTMMVTINPRFLRGPFKQTRLWIWLRKLSGSQRIKSNLFSLVFSFILEFHTWISYLDYISNLTSIYLFICRSTTHYSTYISCFTLFPFHFSCLECYFSSIGVLSYIFFLI